MGLFGGPDLPLRAAMSKRHHRTRNCYTMGWMGAYPDNNDDIYMRQ
jgi:hypothetical protein